ncbi:MAG TPA: ThuA domain-containing protein [Vicinamibacteria bacterium]|nr:ThuA domain-containing protein [Vicinamibacteria bacterium]
MGDRNLGRREFVRLAAGGALAAPALAQAAARGGPARKKALFVHGGWEGHDPIGCRDLFVPWLRENAFDVVVSDTQAPYADAALMKTIDLVVQVWTMGTIAKAPLAGLLAAVKGGTGLAGWHGGLGDAYRQETEYEYMVGGNWVAHPGGVVDYTVNITDHQDPVTAGLTDFKVHSEQYLMHVNPNNQVLATTTFDGAVDPWIDGYTMPVAWKKTYGKGRVFYTSLGHTAEVFKIPQALAIAQRGMLWASDSRYEPTPSLVRPVYPGK